MTTKTSSGRFAVLAHVGSAVLLILAGGCSTTEPTTSESEPGTARTADVPSNELLVDEPRLSIALPSDWRGVPLEAMAEQAEATGIEELARDLRNGVAVAAGIGPGGDQGYVPTVLVRVESGDQSLKTAADRRVRILRTLIPSIPQVVDSRSNIDLQVGRAIRISAHSDPSDIGGIPSQTVEYVLFLDGFTVSIFGTAPEADREFGLVMRQIAEGTASG